MTNPIRKQEPVVHHKRLGVASLSYKWYAVCPTCGEIVPGHRYHRSTRKTAKDALHQHKLKNHAGPW